MLLLPVLRIRIRNIFGSRIQIRSEVKNRIRIKMKNRKLWRLTMAFHFEVDPDSYKKQNPDPHKKPGSGSA
jgi:hypothetical protein